MTAGNHMVLFGLRGGRVVQIHGLCVWAADVGADMFKVLEFGYEVGLAQRLISN